MQVFKEQLKYLRCSNHLKQQEVADFLGVKRGAYTSYETGRTSPSLENLVKLAVLFNTTTDSLLGNHTSASAIINSTPSNYNNKEEQMYFFNLTKDERELVGMYRLSDKKDAIMRYVKKTQEKGTDK